MPRNPGHPPDPEKYPRVDIRLRNDRVIRGVEPAKWRWKPWGWGESAFDIADWQPSK